MAEMDTTTLGIGLGILVAGSYAIIGAYSKRTFELNLTVLIFLAAFSVPGGIALIIAGFTGDANDLPSSWREHVVVAGIVAIGLALHYTFGVFKSCCQFSGKRAEVEAKREQGNV